RTGGRGECADAGLHEHVRRRRDVGPLLSDLCRHYAVSVHHVDRDVAIAGIRRVGDDGPTIGRRGGGGFAHRVVVVAVDDADLGTVARDRIAASLADVCVHEDHAATAEELRTPRDRSAVVAVGGTGDGGCVGDIRELTRYELA